MSLLEDITKPCTFGTKHCTHYSIQFNSRTTERTSLPLFFYFVGPDLFALSIAFLIHVPFLTSNLVDVRGGDRSPRARYDGGARRANVAEAFLALRQGISCERRRSGRGSERRSSMRGERRSSMRGGRRKCPRAGAVGVRHPVRAPTGPVVLAVAGSRRLPCPGEPR